MIKKNAVFLLAILLTTSALIVNAQTKTKKVLKHIVTVTFTENAPQNEMNPG